MVKYMQQMDSKIDRTQAFTNWLNKELDTRGISDRELARRGGVSHSSISLLRSGQMPGLKVLRAIAAGLDVPLSAVLKEAGFDEPLEQTPNLREANLLFSKLSNEEQDTVLTMMRALAEKKRAKSKASPAAT